VISPLHSAGERDARPQPKVRQVARAKPALESGLDSP
jgi:hypothetical protein